MGPVRTASPAVTLALGIVLAVASDSAGPARTALRDAVLG